MIKSLFPILLIIAILFPAPAFPQDFLRVVTLLAPPRIIKKNGALSGMAVELVQEALTRARYTYTIETAPWKRALYMTEVGRADALFYPIYTKKRAKVFHYPSTPLFDMDLVALRRTEHEIIIHPNFQGLQNLTLGVGRGFIYGTKGHEFLQKGQFKKIEETTSNEQSFQKLLDSRIDMLLMDRALAWHLLRQKQTAGKADYVRDRQGKIVILDSVKGHMVFSKKTMPPAAAERFSSALESMRKDGTYQQIISKYQD